MNNPLRILHLEDSSSDRHLIHRLLLAEGIDCEVLACDNRENFLEALEQNKFDLIFADCTLPGFSGLHALTLAHLHVPEVPFIFVSGTIGEDSAIESLRNGATDYVLKDRLSRLIPAVQRAVAEASERARSQEMEARLRQAQHLEAVGTLAGGVAHDFNNILTIIKGHATLLLMEPHRADRVQEIVATINHATQRGTELVGQLLAFARKSDGVFTSTDVNCHVREVVAMLREALPRNIVFETKLEEHLPGIHADPGQIERVIINLATNARDAMPDGGILSFSTNRVKSEKAPFPATEGTVEYLRLVVSDTGVGMDEATRKRIFEPFFTTKAKGKGTGLGLPVIYGLMQSHNGFIDVKSEPGQGTSIALFFPVPTSPLSQRKAASGPTKPAGGTETVLIVDDESDVNYFIEVILKSNGYRVLSARSAEEALTVIGTHPEKIDLLFTDVGLSRLDGFGLCTAARKIKPGLRTILTSGYVDPGMKMRLTELEVDGFIPKPYEIGALLQTIRATLDKA